VQTRGAKWPPSALYGFYGFSMAPETLEFRLNGYLMKPFKIIISEI